MINKVRLLLISILSLVLFACTDVIPEFVNYKVTPANVTFEKKQIKVNENETISSVSTKIMLSESLTEEVTVLVSLNKAETTANLTDEVSFADTTLVFKPGETEKTISISFSDDSILDGYKSLHLQLSESSNYIQLGDSPSFELLIIDNETPTIEFSVTNNTVSESAGSQNVTVNISLQPTEPVMVYYRIISSESTASSSDYALLNGTMQFSSTVLEQDITIDILQDSTYENIEHLVIELYKVSSGYQVGVDSKFTINIEDDDPKYKLSAVNSEPLIFEEGKGSTIKEFTFQNIGNGIGMLINEIGLNDLNRQIFKIESENCIGRQLAVNESCYIKVEMQNVSANATYQYNLRVLSTSATGLKGESIGFAADALGSFKISGIYTSGKDDSGADHFLVRNTLYPGPSMIDIRITQAIGAESYQVTIFKKIGDAEVCNKKFTEFTSSSTSYHLLRIPDCFNNDSFFQLDSEYYIKVRAFNNGGGQYLDATNNSYTFLSTDAKLSIKGFKTSLTTQPDQDSLLDAFISVPNASNYYIEFTNGLFANQNYELIIRKAITTDPICTVDIPPTAEPTMQFDFKGSCPPLDPYGTYFASLKSNHSTYNSIGTGSHFSFTLFTHQDSLPNTNFGFDVDALNYSGDSMPELIIGAPGDNTSSNPGNAYIFTGYGDGTELEKLTNGAAGDSFGYSVANITNFDPGTAAYDSVIVGAPTDNSVKTKAGNFFIYNNYSGSSPFYSSSSIDKRENAQLGFHVANLGNLDGDTSTDIFVSAPFYSQSYPNSGTNYIFDNNYSPVFLHGVTENMNYGTQAEGLENFLDNGGVDEYAIASSTYDGRGVVNIYEGTDPIPVKSFYGENIGDQFGSKLAIIKNFGNLSTSALMITAPGHNKGFGKIYILNKNSETLEDSLFSIECTQATYICGNAISSAGDFNKDGYADFAISSIEISNVVTITHVYSGKTGQVLFTYYGTYYYALGMPFIAESMSHIDYNNDGYDDLILGGYNEDNYGKVFILPGHPTP